MSGPVLHVGHAAVSADVDLQSRTPPFLVVPVRAGLEVRFTYQVHDAPSVEEAWRFRLSVRVDQGRQLVEEARFDDSTPVDEDARRLVVRVAVPPGDHSLHFVAEAALVARASAGGARQVRNVSRRIEGTVHLNGT